MANKRMKKQINKNGILIYKYMPADENDVLSYFEKESIEKMSSCSDGFQIFFKNYTFARDNILRRTIEVNGMFYRIYSMVTNLTIFGISPYVAHSKEMNTIMQEQIIHNYGDIIDMYQIEELNENSKSVHFTNDYRIILDAPEVTSFNLQSIDLPDLHEIFEVNFFCRLCRSDGHKQFECVCPQKSSLSFTNHQNVDNIGACKKIADNSSVSKTSSIEMSQKSKSNVKKFPKKNYGNEGGMCDMPGTSRLSNDQSASSNSNSRSFTETSQPSGSTTTTQSSSTPTPNATTTSPVQLRDVQNLSQSYGKSSKKRSSGKNDICLAIRKAVSKTVGELEPDKMCDFINKIRGKKKPLEVVHRFTKNIRALISQLLDVKDMYDKHVNKKRRRIPPKEYSDAKYISTLIDKLLRLNGNATEEATIVKNVVTEEATTVKNVVTGIATTADASMKTVQDVTEISVSSNTTEVSMNINPGMTKISVKRK